MGNETLTLGQVFWLVTDLCIVVVLAFVMIGAILLWVTGAFEEHRRLKRYKTLNTEYAESADDMLNKYYQEKDEHAKTVDFYTGAIERKDRKIESMIEMDGKRINRIKQLEKQLKDNGIEPEEWDFFAA